MLLFRLEFSLDAFWEDTILQTVTNLQEVYLRKIVWYESGGGTQRKLEVSSKIAMILNVIVFILLAATCY